MEPHVLTDKNQFPTEAVIFSHIGKSKPHWLALFAYIHERHPDFVETWRYYLDGKSWLLKVSRKAKTVFWLSIQKGSFRTTFYFTERAGPAIAGSNLSNELKKQFKDGKRFGKIRGLTIRYKTKRDVGYASELMEIKLAQR